MQQITLRPTQAADIPDLQRVLEMTELFPPEMLPDLLAPSLTGQDADHSHTGRWVTGQLEGRAMGFSFTEPEDLAPGVWNMRALAVAPDHQRHGLGTALVGEVASRLQAEGQRLLIVETSSTEAFAPARAFYAKNGYEAEARIRDFWGPGDDKVILRKAL